MIKIDNLTKNYPGTELYNSFSLEIAKGEVTCILGESGCGKTTLLNCIAGLCRYEGYITPIKCSYVFQTPRLVSNLTVEDNLYLICKDRIKIREMLARVRLTDKSGEYPHRLSGGQAQRVSLARAFLFGGDVLLMDEPFSSLDLKLKREMAELFIELRSEYISTAIFVTHDADEALRIADRIIVLRHGKTVLDEKNAKTENMREKLIDALVGA